jgi:hypothetical protein
MAPVKRSIEERFWENVEKTDYCWNWKGSIDSNRKYGRMWVDGKQKAAHRLSLEIHGKKVSKRSVIMHLCDNPNCVNPDHLQIGTHKDNQQDKVIKGRQAKGEMQGHSILSAIEVKAMKDLHKLGWKTSDIAAALKRNYSPVWQAIKTNWKHIEQTELKPLGTL